MASGSPRELSLTQKYGRAAAEVFARLSERAEVGGHAGVNRYLYDLYTRRPDLQRGYPDIEGEDAWRLVDWAYRYGIDEVPIPPELLPSDWLIEPAEHGARAGVTRYLEQLHSRTPELQEAFPDLDGPDGARYAQWARGDGVKLDPVLRGLYGKATEVPPRPHQARPSAPGVNVIGFLRGELGLGEAARLVITGLDSVEVPVLPVGRSLHLARQNHRFSAVELWAAALGTNLVCLNPDHHASLMRDSAGLLRDRYTIGFWWWEVAGALPLEWRAGFQFVDEIWAGSEHTAAAIRTLAPVPVLKMRIPVVPMPVPNRSRAVLGLPDGFLFLTMFDYNSTVERKNPLAAIEAFKRAFAPADGAQLVVKSVNGDKHPAKRSEIEAASAGRPDIHLIDRFLDSAEKNAMIAACDAFVSLHRAEGFGLPLAEAMYLGKPAIATRYSGNLEFMHDENSYLVSHSMIKVGQEAEPYYPAHADWADPNLSEAAEAMRSVFEDRSEAERRAQAGAEFIRREFSAEAAGRAMRDRLESLRTEDLPSRANHDLESALRTVTGALGGDPKLARGGGATARARALALRLMRPYTYHQERLDETLVSAVEELRSRLEAAEWRETLGRAELLAQLRKRTALIAELEAEVETLRADAGQPESAPSG